MKTEQLEKIIEKQKELIALLDDCNFSTMVDKSQWEKRKELYNELAALEAGQVKDQYGYPLTTTNNHVEFSQSEHRESAEEILKDNLNESLWLFINTYPVAFKSKIMLKDRIVQAMEQYAQQRMPTEEEIEIWAAGKVNDIDPYKYGYGDLLIMGAKWVLDYLKQPKDGVKESQSRK